MINGLIFNSPYWKNWITVNFGGFSTLSPEDRINIQGSSLVNDLEYPGIN